MTHDNATIFIYGIALASSAQFDRHRRITHPILAGFHAPRERSGVIILPISWKGTLAQYVGRLHREHADKRDVRVVDYSDLGVPTLARMASKRVAGYRNLGYVVEHIGVGVRRELAPANTGRAHAGLKQIQILPPTTQQVDQRTWREKTIVAGNRLYCRQKAMQVIDYNG